MCIERKVDSNKHTCYTCTEIQCGGNCVSISEICKEMIKKSSLQQKDVGEKMGWTPQSLSNKLKRNSLSAEEFVKLIEILGYEMKIVSKELQEEVKVRRKGIGERLKMMVDGVKYDTYEADAICHSDPSGDVLIELYKDDEGRFFVAQYANWEGGVNSISPISETSAMKMMSKYE